MKQFQSRVVAAWIVALPLAYGLVVNTHDKITRFRTEPQAEVAREVQGAEKTGFVSMFLVTFGMIVVLTVVVDWLGKLIQRLFPERQEPTKSVEPTNPLV
jgi:carbon starvation protein CstA